MTWLDAELVNAASRALDRKEIVGAAPLQANLLLDYRLPASLGRFASGWAFNANVHYMGNRAANVTNTLHTGSYTTLDLGTRYSFRATERLPMVLRFGVSNATNERYWASVYTGPPAAPPARPPACMQASRVSITSRCLLNSERLFRTSLRIEPYSQTYLLAGPSHSVAGLFS